MYFKIFEIVGKKIHFCVEILGKKNETCTQFNLVKEHIVVKTSNIYLFLVRNWCHPISNFHCKHKRMNIFTICIWIHSIKYNSSIEKVNKHVWCMYYFSFTSNFVDLNMTLTQHSCPEFYLSNKKSYRQSYKT